MSFWTGMDNMCDSSTAAGRAQHEAMEALLEGSGHFDNTQGLYYMGWSVPIGGSRGTAA